MNWNPNGEGWFLPTVIGFAVVLVMVLRGVIPPTSAPGSLPSSAATDPESPVGSSQELAGTRYSHALATPQKTIASVFECHMNGQTIFSDQQCAADARVRSIEAPNRMQPQPMYTETDTRNDRGPAYIPAQSALRQLSDIRAQCDQIENLKKMIDARMREGYSSEEGETLRERLRKLSSEYFELHCNHAR